MRKLILTLVAIIASFGIVSSASATTVVRPFPQGIDSTNKNKAWKQVTSRASVDSSYAQAIAAAAGDTSFSAADYNVEGYGRVSSGTNSATTTGNGQTIGVRDTAVCTVRAKAFVIRHRVTGQKVEICVGCGNVRLKRGTPLRPVRWSEGTVLSFKKTKTIRRTITCPSGQKIRVTIPIVVRGTAHARTWGIVWGRLQAKLQQRVRFEIRGQIQVKCPKAPKPRIVERVIERTVPVPTPTPAPEQPRQPPAPEQPAAPPAPIAETPGLAHAFTNGNADLFLKVKPTPGRDVAVMAEVISGPGTVSGVQTSPTYADEACPTEWKCYRAKFWASNSTGNSTVIFIVTQDDEQETGVMTTISVVPDEF